MNDDDDREWANAPDAPLEPGELEELEEAAATADIRWLEYARHLAATDPRALELSPHAEYLKRLLAEHGRTAAAADDTASE